MRQTSFLIFLFLSSFCFGQYANNRSGATSSTFPSSLRTFPCAGLTIYEESFAGLNQGQLPQDWATFNADTCRVNSNISFLNKGWQAILDYKDSTNTAMASASWYQYPDTSDQWLMTKKIHTGNNTCISWYAYSQDIYYPEKYEVRISTTTQTPAAFLVDSALRKISAEFYSENYRSTNLSAYKNKDVYIAFRQRSYDKFVLVLDNVRFAEVVKKDPAMFSIRTTPQADTSKNVTIAGSIINYGSDTLKIDSAKLSISYRIDGGAIKTMTNKKAISVNTNDTLNWAHDSVWRTPTVFGIKKIEAWISGITGQPLSNDTIRIDFEIVGIENTIPFGYIRLFPNPATEKLTIWMDESATIENPTMSIWDMMGREYHPPQSQNINMQSYNIASFEAGIYFVKVQDKDGKIWTGKFIKQ